MSGTGVDYLCERRFDWGETTTYWCPGDGITGIPAAVRRDRGRLRFAQTRVPEERR